MIFYFHYDLDALAVSYLGETLHDTAENASFCMGGELDVCTKND